jgi:hypothetical protein
MENHMPNIISIAFDQRTLRAGGVDHQLYQDKLIAALPNHKLQFSIARDIPQSLGMPLALSIVGGADAHEAHEAARQIWPSGALYRFKERRRDLAFGTCAGDLQGRRQRHHVWSRPHWTRKPDGAQTRKGRSDKGVGYLRRYLKNAKQHPSRRLANTRRRPIGK